MVLNKKVQKKNKKALKEEKDGMDASNGFKRKAAQEDDDDDDEEDDDVEKEVYSTEDIPRTRKMNKLEAKKKQKKFKRNGNIKQTTFKHFLIFEKNDHINELRINLLIKIATN